MSGYGVRFPRTSEGKRTQLTSHKVLNLFLCDIWSNPYGEKFADRIVAIESGRREFYKNAWDWALSMSPRERAEKFTNLREWILNAGEEGVFISDELLE